MLDLVKILKDCPKGTEFYTSIWGKVEFEGIDDDKLYPITVRLSENETENLTADGKMYGDLDGECILFPSREQRDWSKFTAPWYKKDKFDPKTLKPFDKIIACLDEQGIWCCELFSFIEENTNLIKCCGAYYKYCVPYNDETKYLVGTTEEAPEYYRYWEDLIMTRLEVKRMDFSCVLKYLKGGAVARRESWSGNKSIFLAKDVNGMLPFFCINTKDDHKGVYTATACDLLAEDWVIIKI